MRLSATALIVSAAAALAWAGLSFDTQAGEPGKLQVPDACADGCAPGACCPQQAACGREEHPSSLGDAFGRLLDRGECAPEWSFTADGIALQRSNTRGQALFNDLAGAPALDAEHLNSPVGLAFQLGAVRHGPNGWDVELGYFQVDGWIANTDIAGDSVMVTSADGGGETVSDGHVRYSSALRLAEINLRRQCVEGFTLLAGFRAGELDEAYNATGLGVSPGPTGPISLETRTFNHLYGFHIGGDWEFYNAGGPLRISALCKAGIYGNTASQNSHRIADTDAVLEASRNQATFMGEAGALATYDVSKHLSFRASFTAVWLEGLALAPEQISVNSFGAGGGAGIDTSGGLFYYGGGLGTELRF
jgi:hypothetical protein